MDSEFPDLPDILQTVDLKIYNFEMCNKVYEEYDFELNEKVHFCAYSDDKDSVSNNHRICTPIFLSTVNLDYLLFKKCSGDSGSPVVSDDGKLIGLVSFGIGCAQKDKPGVYTKITAFQEFIETFNGSNSTFYDTRLGFFGVMMSLFMIFKKYHM